MQNLGRLGPGPALARTSSAGSFLGLQGTGASTLPTRIHRFGHRPRNWETLRASPRLSPAGPFPLSLGFQRVLDNMLGSLRLPPLLLPRGAFVVHGLLRGSMGLEVGLNQGGDLLVRQPLHVPLELAAGVSPAAIAGGSSPAGRVPYPYNMIIILDIVSYRSYHGHERAEGRPNGCLDAPQGPDLTAKLAE